MIPGPRFDYDNKFGANWSPSLNVSQELREYFKLKAGIAERLKPPTFASPAEVIYYLPVAMATRTILPQAVVRE